MPAKDRVAYATKRPKARKKHWRDYSDSSFPACPPPQSQASLHPDARVTMAYIDGDVIASAIVEEWAPWRSWQGLVKVEALP